MTRMNYDEFAQAHSEENESSLLNAYYERPAMPELAGDVSGHRILDIGCGSGPLAAAVLERGAHLEGFDSSVAMINLAQRRLGERAPLRIARLGEPLPYAETISMMRSHHWSSTTCRPGMKLWRKCTGY